VLEDIEEFERSGKLEDLTEAVAARTACRAAVKAGQRLLPEEINDILTQLDRTDLPEHCPHGRPVLRVFSVEEIERMFKRR